VWICLRMSFIDKKISIAEIKIFIASFFRFNFIAFAECIINFPFFYFVLLEKYRKHPKTFAFDHCFYSTDVNANNFATQENVFDTIGRDILDNAFQGYNACIFAYGQTGENLINLSISCQFTFPTFKQHTSKTKATPIRD